MALHRIGIREDPEWPVYRCPRCLLQYIEPRFDDVQRYYQEEYRKAHDYTVDKSLSPEERFKMSWQMLGESAQRFKDFVPKGCSVLEIGCSSGSFLSHIQKDYDPYGLEWNPDDAAYVRDVGELPCEEGTLDDCYPGRRFGAIAALQVLEHQADPVAFLKQVRSRLIGGGYLYLELPNASNILLTAIDAPAYRDFFYTEPHITYWEPETLATALQALGFEAAVSVRQRYGIANHINWFLHGKPMADSKQGTDYLEMVPKEHPLYGIMSRTTGKLDKEYRVQLTTLKGGDIITAACRKRDI